MEFDESACKPGSVVDNHSSRPWIAPRFKQPTRFRCGPHHKEPYLVLLRVEFTLLPTVTSGPVRSYRTLSPLPVPKDLGGLLSAALVVGLRPPAVSWHPALWSPDFPPPDHFRHRQRLSSRLGRYYTYLRLTSQHDHSCSSMLL